MTNNEKTKASFLARRIVSRRRPGWRRWSSEGAHAEILSGALRLVDERPCPDATMGSFMRRPGLSRSPHSVYRSDRQGVGDLRKSLHKADEIQRQLGRVCGALANRASADRALNAPYEELHELLINTTEAGIRAEIRAGRSVVQESPRAVARALLLMAERLGREAWGKTPSVDLDDEALDALMHAWSWSVYGRGP